MVTVPSPLFFRPKIESEIATNLDAMPPELIKPPMRMKNKTHRTAMEFTCLYPVDMMNMGL